jgi:hypothetical protein
MFNEIQSILRFLFQSLAIEAKLKRFVALGEIHGVRIHTAINRIKAAKEITVPWPGSRRAWSSVLSRLREHMRESSNPFLYLVRTLLLLLTSLNLALVLRLLGLRLRLRLLLVFLRRSFHCSEDETCETERRGDLEMCKEN